MPRRWCPSTVRGLFAGGETVMDGRRLCGIVADEIATARARWPSRPSTIRRRRRAAGIAGFQHSTSWSQCVRRVALSLGQNRSAKPGRSATFTARTGARTPRPSIAENQRQPQWRPAAVEAAQDTAKIAIGGRRRIRCPRTTTLEAGTAKTAPNDRWKRVQRPNAGRLARNHLNDRLHERGEGLVRRRGSMDARGDGCSGGR